MTENSSGSSEDAEYEEGFDSDADNTETDKKPIDSHTCEYSDDQDDGDDKELDSKASSEISSDLEPSE